MLVHPVRFGPFDGFVDRNEAGVKIECRVPTPRTWDMNLIGGKSRGIAGAARDEADSVRGGFCVGHVPHFISERLEESALTMAPFGIFACPALSQQGLAWTSRRHHAACSDHTDASPKDADTSRDALCTVLYSRCTRRLCVRTRSRCRLLTLVDVDLVATAICVVRSRELESCERAAAQGPREVGR